MVRSFDNRFMELHSVPLRYIDIGEGDIPLLLIHGLGCSIEVWERVIPHFSKEHRVIALDLPGFGKSGKPAAHYSLSFFARYLSDFLTALGVQKAIFMGNSLGGSISLYLALHNPSLVHRLILVCNAGFGTKSSLLLRLLTVPVLGELLIKPYRPAVRLMVEQSFFDKSVVTEAMVNLFFNHISSLEGQRAFLSTLRAISNLRGMYRDVLSGLLDAAPNIRIPTAIIWGRQDHIVPVQYSFTGSQAIPQSELHIIENCGHMPQIECPNRFISLVDNFLTDSR